MKVVTKERTTRASKTSRRSSAGRTNPSVPSAASAKPKRTSTSVERSQRHPVRNGQPSAVRKVHNGTRGDGTKRQRGGSQANRAGDLRKARSTRGQASAKAVTAHPSGVKRRGVTKATNQATKRKKPNLIDRAGKTLEKGDAVRFHSYRGTTLQATVEENIRLGDMIHIRINNDPFPTFVDYHQVELKKEKRTVASKAAELRKRAKVLRIPNWESMDAREMESAIARAELDEANRSVVRNGRKPAKVESELEESDEEIEDEVESADDEEELEEETEDEEDESEDEDEEQEPEVQTPKKKVKKTMPTKRTRTRAAAAEKPATRTKKRSSRTVAPSTPTKRKRTATEAPARSRGTKKTGTKAATKKRTGAPRPPREYEGPNPFAPGSNNYLITDALIKGGKRSALVAKLEPKMKYNPRVHVRDFDRVVETTKRLLAVSYYLKNQCGWDREITGRGETSTIKCTPA